MSAEHISTNYSSERHPWYSHEGRPQGESYYARKQSRNLNRPMVAVDPGGHVLHHQHSNFIPVRHALPTIAQIDVSEEGPHQLNSMQSMKGKT